MRNLTKESRLTSRAYQFAKLIENGYTQETYKDIDFFTLDGGKYFTLKVFHGTAANHAEYTNYRTAERRAEVIQNYKNNYDSRQAYKAEQKIKNKGKLSSHAAAAAAIKAEPDTLQTEMQKTVEFFEETDKKIYGQVQEDTKVIKMLQSPVVKQYDNIKDITEAANNGEMISLLNLCEIVNHV